MVVGGTMDPGSRFALSGVTHKRIAIMTSFDRATAFLTIDVDAVVANWRLIRDTVGPACEAAAVVKADCYGLGSARLAPALAAAGCRSFFVATIDEGIALRQVVPEGTIFVLGGPMP